MKKVVVVRFAEIGLKGRNRSDFERALVENIKKVTGKSVEWRWGRIYVETDWESEDISVFGKVFGIQNYSPAIITELEYGKIEEAVLKLARMEVAEGKKTFKINAKRPYKDFPMGIYDLNRDLGAAVLKNIGGLVVDVHEPEFTVGVEIREEGAVVFSRKIEGPGGLPVGVSGKALLLLSGGIDSPVAGWYAMKRGIVVSALSFVSPPYTGKESKEKLIKLAEVLKGYSGGKGVDLYLCPLTKVLEFLQDNVPRKYMLVMQRRSMMRIANKLARNIKAQVLVTGESVGQVASQTLTNLSVIDQASDLAVLRPLCCFDKIEIINIAKKIGSYDISIIEHPDVCTIFSPKNPSTRVKLSVVKEIEKELGERLRVVEDEAFSYIEKVVV